MKCELFCLLALAGCSAAASAQSAKSIFIDPTSGVVIVPSVSPQATSSRSHQPNAGARVPAITGVNYWIELLTPSGELRRVTSSHAFHTGDRVRLHLVSNVGGRLTIQQSQDGGRYELLFPTANTKNNAIVPETDVAFPSDHTWFRFDNKPGRLSLRLMVIADPVGPPQYTSENQSSGAADPNVNEAVAMSDQARASKGIRVEEDNSQHTGPTTYVVFDARADPSLAGYLTLEVKLLHEK